MGEFSDLLDLRTVLKWRDGTCIKCGDVFENGKIEFDEWQVPPHGAFIDLFENIFKYQFVSPWITAYYYQPNFHGRQSQD